MAISDHVPQHTIQNAITYLLDIQNPDGGFSLTQSNESSVYITALCLKALQLYIVQYNLAETLSSATEFLLTKQLPGGGWSTNWETAIALSSLLPITTDITQYADAVSALKQAQKPDGSWDSSVYNTALALKVLYDLENIELPIDLNSGVMTGRVVNALTGQPLKDVHITFQGVNTFTQLTGTDGLFTSSNLPAPDNYRITYDAAGYQQSMQHATIVKGQLLYLGKIALNLGC